MNRFFNIVIVAAIGLIVSNCCSTKTKNMVEPQPFNIIATYTTWDGSQPNEKGVDIRITIDNSEIQLESVYFKNVKTELKKYNTAGHPVYVGSFKLPSTIKDYILHSDPKKEYGNTPPSMQAKIDLPFELQENEAAVSYFKDGEKQYFKIKNVARSNPDMNKQQ